MSNVSIKSTWIDNMSFSIEQPGGSVNIDTSMEHGGKSEGLRPKAMMLSALAGCTGMDVTSLLKKMRVIDDVLKFTIEIHAVLSDEHPKVYTDTKVIYTFTGTQLDRKKIEKAVSLSVDRYCGVYEMFRSFSKMTTEIVYLDK